MSQQKFTCRLSIHFARDSIPGVVVWTLALVSDGVVCSVDVPEVTLEAETVVAGVVVTVLPVVGD